MVKIKHERQRRPNDVAVQVGQAEAHVSQSNRAPEGHERRLHTVPTPLQRDLGMLLPRLQHSAGVGQLGAAQVDFVVAHHPLASMWSTLKGLVEEAGGAAGQSAAQGIAGAAFLLKQPVQLLLWQRALSSSITAFSLCWLRSLQQQRSCMFTRTAALMSRSCKLTQVLIYMCRPLMKRVSRAP